MERIPAGWQVPPCGQTDPHYCLGIAGDPRTGEVADLAGLHSRNQFVGVWQAGGVLWGWSGSRGTAVGTAVSRDGGATWQPTPFTQDVAAVAASRDGRTWYALVRTGAKTLSAYRTDDAGATWHATGGSVPERGAAVVGATVRPDGALVLQVGSPNGFQAGPPRLYLSTDRGTSFTEVSVGPGAMAQPVPGGYAQAAYDGGMWLSTDLAGWWYVKPPR